MSRGRLVEGVWGDAPPASAAHSIESYISRLRKVLEEGDSPTRLLTRSPGYLLRVNEGELDLQRLEALMDQGRRALSSDDPSAAASAFREGLALFRGAPLEDLPYAPFHRAEVGHLDDLRLAAIELRIDAELALGKHSDVIGELSALIAKHPLRERFWEQLMLALYRSGRQGEALAMFDRVRRDLAEELGVDPGHSLQQLQRRMLRQDPVLEPPGPERVVINIDSAGRAARAAGEPATGDPERRSLTRSGHPSWRGHRPAVLGAAVVAAAAMAAVLAAVVLGSGGHTTPIKFAAGLAIVDASTGKQMALVPLSNANQGYYTYTDGHVWGQAWGDAAPDLFVEIDPKSGRVMKRLSPTSDVGAYTIAGKHLWEVGDRTLAMIDTHVGREVARYPLPKDPAWPGGQTGIAAADGSLWVTRAGLDELLKVDPKTGRVVRRYLHVPAPATIAVGGGSAWTISHFSGVTVVDLKSGSVVRARIPSGVMQFVVSGGGYGWVPDEQKGVVYKLDASGNAVATYRTGEGARAVSYADGVLWVANQDVGTVTGIDAVTGATRTIRFGHPTADIVAGGGSVLVLLATGRTYEDRINALTGRVARLLVQPYQLAGDDPALYPTWLATQVEYATCAKLLNYPDVAGTSGAHLRPEVAASMPTLSDHQRAYTFTIRPGYRFSPPSGQSVTAETFRYSIERALSPGMGADAPGPRSIGDIAGESAFRAGAADHISGLKADGDTLTIRLVKSSPNFLERLALPFFCPVLAGSPAGLQDGGVGRPAPHGETTIPSAGPYYIADFNSGEYLILKRNPNYTGPRPHRLDAIALREGIDPGQAVARVENGSWDAIIHLYDPLFDPSGEVAHKWGPDSPATTAGDQRYYPVPMPGLATLAFNAGQRPFSEASVRQAAALALNRSALTGSRLLVNPIGDYNIPEAPSSQLLAPNQPGYRTGQDPYPLRTSNLSKARSLIRGRRFTARLAATANCDACQQWARAVKHQLAPIGITVDITDVTDAQVAVRKRPTKFDLFEADASQDFPDPAAFLTTLFGHDLPPTWLPPHVRSRLASLRSLTGPKRTTQAATLARRLATTDVPATAFAYLVNGQFFSPRLGCRIFPPFGYGVDLAALCLQHP